MIIPCGNESLDLSKRTHIMGILNVTPDSFSDGGDYLDPHLAVQYAQRMLEDGADIIDIGGESTRPYGDPVSVDEELKRVLPVVTSLAKNGITNISVDTRRANVAERCLDAGASWINDVSALRDDQKMREIIQRSDAVILMHRQGVSSKVMQKDPKYVDVVGEVASMLHEQARIAEHHGMPRDRIILDPGIGFGKTVEHNLELTRNVGKIGIGYPILYGPSRKQFLGTLTGIHQEKDRDVGTMASIAVAVRNGASIVRVHNVKMTREFLTVLDAI